MTHHDHHGSDDPVTGGNEKEETKDEDDDIRLLRHQLAQDVRLALGTLQWGTTWIDDAIMNAKGAVDEDTARDIWHVLQHSPSATADATTIAPSSSTLLLIDTAEGYGGGTSEKRVGRLVAAVASSTASPEAIPLLPRPLLMTKFLPAPWRLFEADFVRACRASAHRLQVTCIDLYLLHSPVHWCRDVTYWIRAAATCRKLGLLRAVGLSNCTADQVRRACHAGREYGVTVLCNQVHYSLLDYRAPALQDMQRTCAALGVTVIGFTVLGQGLLTSSLTRETFATNQPARMMGIHYDELTPLRACLQQCADKYHKSMAQIAINWCRCHDVIPLVGCRSAAQAADSLGGVYTITTTTNATDESEDGSSSTTTLPKGDVWHLDPEDVKALDQVALNRSALESPSWRRMIFVTLFSMVMVVCRMLDFLGWGDVTVKKRTVTRANAGTPVTGPAALTGEDEASIKKEE